MSARPSGLAAYGAVTGAYWAFMLTDGALRMLVLLHFHQLGFGPLTLAYLFLLYELMGVVTNLSAGWIAARFGLMTTLYGGLSLQIIALGALTQLDPGWALTTSVIAVMLVQGLSGVAKDLTKTGAKSAVKLLAPAEEAGALFRWVALLTGSKNAVKGLGSLLGAGMLATIGFVPALTAMAIGLVLILVALLLFMPSGLPSGRKGQAFRDVFSKDQRVNRLSAARLFLFGARDCWFVVGVPLYFYAVLSDGTPESQRQAFFLIGCFMAVWIIGYGAIQALAPKLLRARHKSVTEIIDLERFWVGALTAILAVLAIAALVVPGQPLWFTLALVLGLLLFGAVFALNSALHSYLILALTKAERVTLDVGFYYMSNAAGRLLGTLLSGLSFQLGGLWLCLAVAGGLSALSWLSTGWLQRAEAASPA
ncbi:MAG: organoarsenical effux MFS transporter ArsJ [Pseudomonadota bacterium]